MEFRHYLYVYKKPPIFTNTQAVLQEFPTKPCAACIFMRCESFIEIKQIEGKKGKS